MLTNVRLREEHRGRFQGYEPWQERKTVNSFLRIPTSSSFTVSYYLVTERFMRYLSIYLLALMVGFTSSGCSDDADEKEFLLCCMVIDSNVDLAIKDTEGNDLLDPDTPGALRQFRVYYERDGEKTPYKPVPGGHGGFVIEKWSVDATFHLKVFVDNPLNDPRDNDNDERTTYLEFKDGTIDTIRAVFTVKPGYVVIEKAWYNNTLAWDRSRDNGGIRTFELLKP